MEDNKTTPIKDFAKQRNLSLKKLKDIALSVLGYSIGEELTEDEITKIDNALLATASEHLPQDQKTLAQSATSDISAKQQQFITQTIGTQQLETNAQLYFETIYVKLQNLKFAHDKLMFAFEQSLYDSQADVFSRMTRNIERVLDSKNFESLADKFTNQFNSIV